MSGPIDTGTDDVLAEVRDRVGVLTLNRPERRNALSAAMYPALADVLARFVDDDEVGCVMLTGSGSAFCAGGDVRDGAARPTAGSLASEDERVAALLRDAGTAQLLHEHPKLTVAALPGAAVGAGLSLALACDFRIAAEGAVLRTGWGRLALSGDFGGPWFLTRLVGPSKALELLVGNEAVTAPGALALGLVSRVVPDEGFAEAALAWCRELASGPTTAHQLMKENVRASSRRDLADALALEARNMARATRTPEHREAVKAWLEGRPPKFS